MASYGIAFFWCLLACLGSGWLRSFTGGISILFMRMRILYCGHSAIPESTRSSIILRLLDHTEKNWPQLAKVQARYHGSFAYITGVLPGGEQIPLFRLRYGGSAHLSWATI